MATAMARSGTGRETALRAPFTYFGGKSSAAHLVWDRLGAVQNYVEPFAGSLAVLLARPHKPKIETVNDKCRFIANFWRAVRFAPDEVADHADWPVNEPDLEARHYWLVTEGAKRLERILGDPDASDAKVAGWWVWGICAWIGSGWCSGEGPWVWSAEDGWHKRNAGMGINRQRPHLGDAGMGINRQLPHLGNAGRGEAIAAWMHALAERLRDVRVCCGDWLRVCGNGPTIHHAGITGVFLDPPYSAADRADCYNHESRAVAHEARVWAIEAGGHPRMRIAFCGYAGEFVDPWPEGWVEVPWVKMRGNGYGNIKGAANSRNDRRERIWFSPHCLRPGPTSLFEVA